MEPVAEPRRTTPEYRAALEEWHSAMRAWEAADEPQYGPIFDRLNAARKEFTRLAQPSGD